MSTAIKFITGTICLLIGLFIITIIVLTKVVNPNDYRQHIDKYIFQKTGRHLLIGKIGWSFIPWLGVDLQKVQVTNPTGFKGSNLANIGEVKIKVRFWPLLTFSMQLGKIVIKNANINLITNSAGKQNWSDWRSAAATKPQATESIKKISKEPKPSRMNVQMPVHQVKIASIRITNSTINLINQKAKTKTKLSDFDFKTGTIDNAQNFPIKMSFDLEQSNSKNKTAISATAVANLDIENNIYKLHRVVISTKTRRSNLPIVTSTLKGIMGINLPKQTLTLSPFTAQITNMVINGRLQITRLLQIPRITANVSSQRTALQPFITALQGKSKLKGTLSFSSTITTSGLSKKALIANLNGQGKMTVSNGVISGFNLNDLLAQGSAIVHQQQVPQNKGPMQTSLSNLSATYVINRGVLRNNDLRLVGNQVSAQGIGVVNLNNGLINYVLRAQYRATTTSKSSLELPIKIQGPLSHPKVQPDYSGIAKQVFSNTIENKIKNYVGQAGKQLNFKKLFKGL